MGYQSKTYSLSDEVVAAIDEARAGGLTPNQFLRRVLGIELGSPLAAPTPVPIPTGMSKLPDYEIPPAYTDPREIPGVSVGPPKRETTGGYPCRCIHSGCRGSRFTGTSKFQNLCPECAEGGHKGEPRNCQACADDSATGAL